MAPVTMTPPPATATLVPATATATMAPTTTITPTATLSPTLTGDAHAAADADGQRADAARRETMIAAHTATYVPPIAMGRPTQPIQLPLVSLPTRAPREVAPTFTPETEELIPGQGEVTDVTPVSETPTTTASSIQVEWTWAQSVNGALIEAQRVGSQYG